MNRLIVLTITAITLCNTVCAQQHPMADSLKTRIDKRESSINTDIKKALNSKEKDLKSMTEENFKSMKKEDLVHLIVKLGAQMNDYEQLRKHYDEEIIPENETLKSENSGYKSILASDVSVFSNIPEINENVPVCLRKHISLIQKIWELENKIKNLEDKITDIQNNSPYASDEDKKRTITRVIKEDLNIIDKLFNEVADLDMGTLSEEQKKFYDPGLTERYNKFLIYFE